ncbi:hypothetical protein SAMN04489721_3037 [Agromyces flavus]|uniref:Core-2/I-Branching enzyme n=1 Tax=Agromyces flavus TaxID=589382 RepID=A0A1H1Z759_9MICO|nr:hypothetical protein GCM10010932_15850 [Agromyces flavus]SDT29611.1 hypothetical protein SAMN04489721_3037 [Agromyces flavus]
MNRLAQAILASSPSSRVLIAHDGRHETFPTRVPDERIEIVEHGLAADWGSWELVEAMLEALIQARERTDPDLVCLISGQDYPVRRLEEWESEAIAAQGWIGSAEPIDYTPRWGRRRGVGSDNLTRYAYRWFRTPASRMGIRVPGRSGDFLRRLRDAIALRAEPLVSVRHVTRGRGVYWGVRRIPSPFGPTTPCWYGSQWLALHRRELDRLVHVDLAPGSRLRRLYRRSIIPDESALVTALAWRRPPAPLPPVSHMVWDVARDEPKTWTRDDLEILLDSGSPFCRKVDPVASTTLLDALDDVIVASR